MDARLAHLFVADRIAEMYHSAASERLAKASRRALTTRHGAPAAASGRALRPSRSAGA
jgi:hypothetical protein